NVPRFTLKCPRFLSRVSLVSLYRCPSFHSIGVPRFTPVCPPFHSMGQGDNRLMGNSCPSWAVNPAVLGQGYWLGTSINDDWRVCVPARAWRSVPRFTLCWGSLRAFGLRQTRKTCCRNHLVSNQKRSNRG